MSTYVPEYMIDDLIVAYMHMTHAYLMIQMTVIVTGQGDSHESESCNAAIRIFAALKGALGGNDGMMLSPPFYLRDWFSRTTASR